MKQYVEDIHHGYDFDSTIDPPYLAEIPTSYELAIILRLYMVPLNPPKGKATYLAPDADGRLWPAMRWNSAAWLHFKERYIKLVLQVWDKAFILIPPKGFNGFVWPDGGERRNLLCRLRVKLQDQPEHAHAMIQLVRLASASTSFFRSDSDLYDSSDVDPQSMRWAPEGVTFTRNTPAHEIGHLLGFYWHVGIKEPGCETNTEGACYGTNLHDRMNVMGAGGMLDLANAKPWLDRVPEHVPSTEKSDWKVTWASSEAQLRGLDGLKVDERFKKPYQAPKPGIIDL